MPPPGALVQVVDVCSAAVWIDRGATVLDARDPAAFAQGHVPNARTYAWQSVTGDGASRGRVVPNTPTLNRTLASLGLDGDRPALVYGDGARGWGEEGHAAWTLALLGHPEVAVLDGGFAAWAAGGRTVATSAERHSTGRFEGTWHQALIASKAEILAPTQLLDVRSAAEFAGATPFGEARGGHIAAAHHLDWHLLFDDGLLASADTMRRRLTEAGVDPDRGVICYCTCGVRSAMAAVAMIARGIPQVRNYDGSLAEWSADASAPME